MGEDVEMFDSPTGSEEQLASSAHKTHASNRSKEKCDECRHRKKKCLPVDRDWPGGGKCDQCKAAGLPCGPNKMHSPADGRQSDADVQLDIPAVVRKGSAGGPIPDSQWDLVRGTFSKLYIQDSLSLKKVMAIMKENYNFYATPKQWHKRIEEWGLRKYKRGLSSDRGRGSSSAASTPLARHADLNRRSASSSVDLGGVPRMLPHRRMPFHGSGEAIHSRASSIGRSPPHSALARNQHHSNNDNYVLVEQSEIFAGLDYSPLPHSRSIRLLQLLEGTFGEPIQATLTVTEMEDSSPYYFALSYQWGETKETENVKINDSIVPIKRNLEEALRHFRDQTVIRDFWIDSICINQDDVSEKEMHLQLMAKIFAGAASVLVWLGPTTAESSAAIDFARKCAEMKSLEQLLRAPPSVLMQKTFREMLRMPWFCRRWAIIEISFAKSCTLHCGRSSILWADFVFAIEVLMTFEQSTTTTFFPWAALGLSHEFFDEVKTSGLMQLISVTTIVARRVQTGKATEVKLSVEVLLYMSRFLETECQLDYVYALVCLSSESKIDDVRKGSLPLANAALISADTPSSIDTAPEIIESPLFVMDYHKPLSIVCREVVEFVLKTSESIDIVCRPWAPYWFGHPSWISTLDRDSFKSNPNGVFTRVQADALVGEPGQVSNTYNASRSTARYKYQFGTAIEESILKVRGFLLDKIQKVASVAKQGYIPADWLELGASNWEAVRMPAPEIFWRTLVADRGTNGKNAPPSFFARACKWAFSQIVAGEELDTKEMLREPSSPPYVAPFLRRVQAVIWRRKLFITETGLIGIGPEQLQPGDSVHILLGCSVPVILRKIINETNYFELIGASYVHDKMDGEACRDAPAFSELRLK